MYGLLDFLWLPLSLDEEGHVTGHVFSVIACSGHSYA